MPIGDTPRTVTFMPVGLSTLGRLMTVTISGEAIGSPALFAAIPGLTFRIWKASRVTELFNSAFAPFRSTSTCNGWPDGFEGCPQPFDQRQVGDQHRDGQRDAERGHEGRGLAHDQVAQVVGDWYRHRRYPV